MSLQHPDLPAILDGVRRFVREAVVPREEQIDRDDHVPDELREQAADMGLFGFALPEEYGGLGLTSEEEAHLAFELGWTTPAFRSMFGTNNAIGGQAILQSGTDEQRARYLPGMTAGRLTTSFALTEPEAGSDAASLRTTARRTHDGYVIDGHKHFITNAPIAGLFVVFARTGSHDDGPRGISALLVEADREGITVGPRDAKMGQAGAISAPVTFDGVHVPFEALLGGEEGRGFSAAMGALNRGRLHLAALCVGMADRLISESLNYAESREQFGQPIADFQLVQGMLARSQTQTHAGRALVLEACRAFDDGHDVAEQAAAAKFFCSEMVGLVADNAVQIHGGTGYIRGVPVERFYRDARLYRIYEGTSEIQQLVIAKEMRRRHARST